MEQFVPVGTGVSHGDDSSLPKYDADNVFGFNLNFPQIRPSQFNGGFFEIISSKLLCLPPARMHFCELTAGFNLDISMLGADVPRNKTQYSSN